MRENFDCSCFGNLDFRSFLDINSKNKRKVEKILKIKFTFSVQLPFFGGIV